MSFLLITLVVIAVTIGLMVLYHVGRKNKRVGSSVGFGFSVLSRIPVKLEDAMNKAARYLHESRLASLAYPPGVGESDYWPGINLLSRLVLFTLALCILPGETANVLLLMPTLFHTAIRVNLPGVVEYASAALLICVPALFGSVCLECMGIIPHGAGLFREMRTLKRWIIGFISFVFLILSIFVTAYTYVFRAVYLDSPDSTQGMSAVILGGLGSETAVAAVLALWALVVGGAGVFSLLLLIAEHVCKVIGACVSFIPAPLNDIAVHVGGVSVYQDFGKPDVCQVPSVQFQPTVNALPGQTTTALLPQNTSVVDASVDPQTEEVAPAQTILKEVQMNRKPENAAIVLVGNFGTQMLSPITQKISELRATGSIRSWFYLDLSVNHVNATIDGVVDHSPTHTERQAVLMHEETEDQAYRKLFNNLAVKIVGTHLDAKAYPDALIFIIDCHQLITSVEMLKSVSHRLPLHSLVVLTELLTIDAKSISVQTGIRDMESLYAKDIIETFIVTDSHSPLSAPYGADTQHLLLAHALAGLVLSHKHSSSNPSFVNVLRSLHRLSPYTALNFASEDVAIGNMPKPWGWVPGLKGEAGAGNYGDILAQTRIAIDRCFTKEDTRTYPSLVYPDSACVILLSEPMRLDDERFPALVHENALYVKNHYPNASCITVRGNGQALPHHLGSRLLVTAACLYPLAPDSLQQMYESRITKVTTLYPVSAAIEPASSNGTHSAKDQKPVVGKAKPASTPRQKKAAPSQREVRKNAKEAK